MKKKIFGIFSAAVLTLVSVFSIAGCHSDGRITIEVGMWPEQTSPDDVAMWEIWKRNFETDYPEYKIVGRPYQYSKDVVMADGFTETLPTVFQTYFTEPEFLISNDYIADITDELKSLKVGEGADAESWYDCMDPYMRDTVTRDGRVYGVPRDGYGLGLFLNLNMLRTAGVVGYDKDYVDEDKGIQGRYLLYNDDGTPRYPTTFDEVREVSELVKQYVTGATGMVILSADKNGGWQFSNMAWNFGCESLQIDNGDGTWTANLNDPGAVKALKWIQDMRTDDLVPRKASNSFTDWYTSIYSNNVAMAICGSDSIMLPVTNGDFNKDDIAFVPMPSDGEHTPYSLYGGTPFVFSRTATSEQIHGALLFLKYIGRSPEVDEISLAAMELGNVTALAKGIPVIPTIKAWINKEYVEKATELENKYCNVNLEYYQDFFDTIEQMKRPEEPNFCQDMYELLDRPIQSVLADDGSTKNCSGLLGTENNTFQNNFLNKLK